MSYYCELRVLVDYPRVKTLVEFRAKQYTFVGMNFREGIYFPIAEDAINVTTYTAEKSLSPMAMESRGALWQMFILIHKRYDYTSVKIAVAEGRFLNNVICEVKRRIFAQLEEVKPCD